MTTSIRACACGCEQTTRLRNEGSPNQFIHGHNRRGTSKGWKQNGYWHFRINGENKAFHRWVVEQGLGRELTSEEIVHHIDHDPLNNDPDNLVILTRSEHTGLHRRGKKGPQASGETRARALDLYASGMTQAEVALATGTPHSTLAYWVKQSKERSKGEAIRET